MNCQRDQAESSEHTGRDRVSALQREIRLLVLLHSAQSAGLVPIGVRQLHVLVYLSNVLAPVWELPPLDGKVLKLRGGPYYPTLQHDLDRLVARGMVLVSHLGYTRDEQGHWRLEGAFRLNRLFAEGPIRQYEQYEQERRLSMFIDELAYALAALSDKDLATAAPEDATYGDEVTSYGNVIDFGEWQSVNYSARAADYFQCLLPGGASPTRGERLHLYARHLRRRLHGG